MISATDETIVERWVMKCPACQKIIVLRSMSFKNDMTERWDTFHWIDLCENCGYDRDFREVNKVGNDHIPFGLLVPVQERAL